MNYKLLFKPIIFVDVEEVYLYYEKIVHGLGKRFYENFLLSIKDIQHHPNSYLYVYKPVRRHFIKGFPYKVFYIVEEQNIFILGVTHAKRSEKFIRRKLGR